MLEKPSDRINGSMLIYAVALPFALYNVAYVFLARFLPTDKSRDVGVISLIDPVHPLYLTSFPLTPSR
jgi:hypothetical protein